VQPFFSPDSRQVLYLDKPSSEAPTGIYGIDVTDPAATPELVTEMIGYRSPDRTVVATIEGNLTRFLEEGTGQSWTVDTGGNRPHYAPDGSRIIWSATDASFGRLQTLKGLMTVGEATSGWRSWMAITPS
jgi:hypothetical protein